MSAAKTLAWGGMIWAVIGSAGRAEAGPSDRGSWVFFFNGSGTSPYDTNPQGTPPAVATPPVPIPSAIAAPATPTVTSATFNNPYAVMRSPVFTSVSAASVTASDHTATISTSTMAPTSDVFLNFGGSGFLESSQLTVGTPQPWYQSPAVTRFFNNQTPSAQDQSDFTNKVLQDVRQTFAASGLNPTLTLDPNASTNHTLSIVSGASYGPNPNAIGITDVGHNGFGFIDKFTYAQNVDELAMAVAHNVSHELMHAFGVGYHPDTTGAYVDAGTATWAMLTNPSSTFSPAAVKAINDAQSGAFSSSGSTGAQTIDGDQEILAAPVPEPSTVAVWTLGLACAAWVRRRTSRPAA